MFKTVSVTGKRVAKSKTKKEKEKKTAIKAAAAAAAAIATIILISSVTILTTVNNNISTIPTVSSLLFVHNSLWVSRSRSRWRVGFHRLLLSSKIPSTSVAKPSRTSSSSRFVPSTTTTTTRSSVSSSPISAMSSSSSSSSSSTQSKATNTTTPSYYLMKSEPDDYSISQLETDGTTEWDGVRNYAARKHLRNMMVGDKCFFYHSSCKVPAIVGTCTVVRTAQPDPTFVVVADQQDDDGEDDNDDNDHDDTQKKTTKKKRKKITKENPWVSVLVQFESLWGGDGGDNNNNDNKQDETYYDPQVTLKELKNQALSNPIIANMILLKISRLSVMPVSPEEWNAVHDLKERKKNGEELLLGTATAATTQQVKTTRKRPRGSASTTKAAPATTASSKKDDTESVDDDDDDDSSSGGSRKTSENSKKKKKKTEKKKNDKKAKVASTSTASATDTNVDDPNYCTIPSEALSDSQIRFILSSSSSSSEYQDTTGKKMKSTKITEKDLGLSGRKFMYKIDVASGDDGTGTGTVIWVFHYDGTKFIGKDKKRLDAMLDAVKSDEDDDARPATAKVYLLLSVSSGICRRNTLPALLNDGVIVQRVRE